MLILPPQLNLAPSDALLLPLPPVGFVKHAGLWVPDSVASAPEKSTSTWAFGPTWYCGPLSVAAAAIASLRQLTRPNRIELAALEIGCRLPADLCVRGLIWSLAEAEIDFNDRLTEVAIRNGMRIIA